ncbi:hypothetical protein RLV_0430 (plasmid) [Rhizobium leguminosarum bv. viciae]|nr:hypothetical protein RLV_0430 [Rhizobium leguminosarum bv. viciae]
MALSESHAGTLLVWNNIEPINLTSLMVAAGCHLGNCLKRQFDFRAKLPQLIAVSLRVDSFCGRPRVWLVYLLWGFAGAQNGQSCDQTRHRRSPLRPQRTAMTGD